MNSVCQLYLQFVRCKRGNLELSSLYLLWCKQNQKTWTLHMLLFQHTSYNLQILVYSNTPPRGWLGTRLWE